MIDGSSRIRLCQRIQQSSNINMHFSVLGADHRVAAIFGCTRQSRDMCVNNTSVQNTENTVALIDCLAVVRLHCVLIS